MNHCEKFLNTQPSVQMTDCFRLVKALIADIQHLESEVVHTRYELSSYLTEKERNLLRSDILSNLAGRYASDPAYDAFV